MVNPQERFDELVAKLRARQCRLTPQRLALLRLLVSSTNHPSAADLYDQLRAQFPTTSLATVYKTLSLLDEMGEVLELGFSDDVVRYDASKPYAHPHLICIRCHKIADAEMPPPTELAQQAAGQSGFRLLGQRVEFYGLCPDCQSAERDG